MDASHLNRAQTDWERVNTLYNIKRVGRPKLEWLNGVSTRLHIKRLSRLLDTKEAKAVKDFLFSLPDARLKAMRVFSSINHEQAISAFRLTIIANITVPIFLLAVFNQSFPGKLQEWGAEIYAIDPALFNGLAIAIVMTVLALLYLIYVTLSRLNHARDIRHLVDLYAAERGIFFGLEDSPDSNIPQMSG